MAKYFPYKNLISRVSVWYLLSICVFLAPLLLFPSSTKATSLKDVSYTITISASIGEPKLTLFGYTSPSAKVELRGNRVVEDARANNLGYFFFDRVFLPVLSTSEVVAKSTSSDGELTHPELCLISIDTQNRSSFPTCLPSLPIGPYNITVGPVLLPPTISLEQGKFLPGEQIVAQGATIPLAEVIVFLANDFSILTKIGNLFTSPAYAYFLPHYQSHANENGQFEFNLPNNQPSNWRVFVGATRLGSPTPKSNTLTFKILFWWEWLWEKIKRMLFFYLNFLKPYFWLAIILAETTILYWLWRKKRKGKQPLSAS